MPKKPPKYCKLKKYAVVYLHGKTIYLGLHGSPESKTAYARIVAESKANPTLYLPKGESGVSVKELALSFLDHAKETLAPPNYGHHRIAVGELIKLYGDDTPVDSFTPSCLKLFRRELINARNQRGEPRFCRGMVNDYVSRVIRIFRWGVEEEHVHPHTLVALKAIKVLPEGYPGTFDNPEREHVPDDVIRRTIPHCPPTIRAMIILQRLTGCRPSEIFNMRVGQIDQKSDPELWLYKPPSHKTQKKTKRKKIVPLGKPEQELIMPYLVGKQPEAAVFSPRTAQQERYAGKRAIPQKYSEFYNKDSYRMAVEYAIAKGNRKLSDGETLIPKWSPYQLRHAASSAMEVEAGLDASQMLLDHSTPNTTARYNHRRLEKQKELARNRHNPFNTDDLANGQVAEYNERTG